MIMTIFGTPPQEGVREIGNLGLQLRLQFFGELLHGLGLDNVVAMNFARALCSITI
jgi:hypothetical protein